MKKHFFRTTTALLVAAALFTACTNDDPTPSQQGQDKYVLITLADRVSGTKAGFISAFDKMPTGTVSNASAGSLEGQGMGGWRTYGNHIFKMFRTSDYATGIEKINVTAEGMVTAGQFISSKDPAAAAKYFGTGNFVIKDENTGYYWDAAEPTKIQKFNPTSMTANLGSIDLTDAINERGADEEGIKFRSAGQKFLAIKGNKLYANLTYAKQDASQIGFFDDFFPDVYIAVIDLASETYEKTISIKNTGSIAYINENHMYDFDDNGDLYIVTQGTHPRGLGGRSKIARIKANETDVDATWELDFDIDAPVEHNGKFVNVFAKDGELILTVNTEPLTGGPTGNINAADIWKFYAVDIATKGFTEITGVPVGTNPGAAMAVVEVDGKTLLRGSTVSGDNGYYEYDPANHAATLLFSVNVGGAVSGFHQVTVQ